MSDVGPITGSGCPVKMLHGNHDLVIVSATRSMPRRIWGEAFRRRRGLIARRVWVFREDQQATLLPNGLRPAIADGRARVVVSGAGASRRGRVVVATLPGEVVWQMPMAGTELFVDLRSLPPGHYLVRYSSDGRAVTTPLTILHR